MPYTMGSGACSPRKFRRKVLFAAFKTLSWVMISNSFVVQNYLIYV